MLVWQLITMTHETCEAPPNVGPLTNRLRPALLTLPKMNKHERSQIHNQSRSLYQEITPTPTMLIWMIPLHCQCDDVTDIFQKSRYPMRKILSIRCPVEFRLTEEKTRWLHQTLESHLYKQFRKTFQTIYFKRNGSLSLFSLNRWFTKINCTSRTYNRKHQLSKNTKNHSWWLVNS